MACSDSDSDSDDQVCDTDLRLRPYTTTDFLNRLTDSKKGRKKDRCEDDESLLGRKKLKLSREQAMLLEESFKQHSTLTMVQKQALAEKLDLKQRQVEVWFQNRRARMKLKQTEMECKALRKNCERLMEENRRLSREILELRSAVRPEVKSAAAPPYVYHFHNMAGKPIASSSRDNININIKFESGGGSSAGGGPMEVGHSSNLIANRRRIELLSCGGHGGGLTRQVQR